MFLRALAILFALIAASVALSFAFGAEVLAALGLIASQLKIVLAKVASVSWKGIIVWLKAQGINFARVEVAKRWFLKSILPLIIGAAMQRRIAEFFKKFVDGFKRRRDRMMAAYRSWPKHVRIVSVLAVIAGMLALTISTMSIWLILISVQLPIWIIAATGSLWHIVWRTIQKLIFRTLAFMQLYKVWGFLKKRVPETYLRRKRAFDFRVARMVVKQRKLTVAQLHAQKHGWAMRWSLLKAYFRNRRPSPTDEELDRMAED